MKFKLILGSIVNPQSDTRCGYYKDGMLLFKSNGAASEILYTGKSTPSLFKKFSIKECEVHDYQNHLIMPAFFDMHFHWVQDDVRTKPKASLLKWLEKYAWPGEMKFADKDYSKQKAADFFARLAAVGTLGGACYSSIHAHSVDHAQQAAMGDFTIGNVLMTMNSPAGLLQTPKQANQLVARLSKKYKKHYAFTPRFAPTTHIEVMQEGAKICRLNGSFIQTHLSETPEEIAYVLDLFKKFKGFEKVKTYTEIYHKCGVLGPRTIMGHGIHLGASERKLLAKTNTAIAHCPTSNAPIEQKGLGSGLFDFKKIENAKIRWALATDIGGGPYLSMFDVMRSFVDQNKKNKQATYTKALYRSTLAGAELMNLQRQTGNLNPGKIANFIVLKEGMGKGADAEKVLSSVIKPLAFQRHRYGKCVKHTYLKGQLIH